ncbi:AAA domain (dynein-related subfamily) family protein [Cryptosporidium meleagridis]|uniref:Midasin n=1 Tax=Cryptosporidium meleagridis TaxID=93969 RepID=A0A2P4Z588_9CRYT|nr:AAA domain (dynein-related subfamily) family protein [Cryptosporidium meleagridis]
MSLIERSKIILQEVTLREDQIRLCIKDNNYQFAANLKDAIRQLEEILSTLDSSQLQNSELTSRIPVLLRRMVLYSEIGDIVLERFPVIIFGLIEDIFKEGIEYKEHGMLETFYISRYLYLVVSLLDLPYFVDSFSLFWCKEQERKKELLLLLDNIIELLAKLDEVNKEELLNKVRDLATLNLLWERVIPVRDYLKSNHKLYEIIEKFMLNLQNYKKLNKTIKYLFLRLYSNVVQLGEGKIQLYRENHLEDLFISIQINQEYAIHDEIDLYLQYFIFKRPYLSAFSLVFSKSQIDTVSISLNNDIQIHNKMQNKTDLSNQEQLNKSNETNQITAMDIYDPEIINNLKELVLSSVLTRTSLIFLENINNGMQIYFHLINQIKTNYFQDKCHFKIVRLYLDNTIDSKSLLGNWIVGDKPGEFKWEYGILSQCLINGDWLIIENIQDSPKDVIIKLNEISEQICYPLVNGFNIDQSRIQETHYFEISEFNRKIKIHPNFRIFSSCIYTKQNNHWNNHHSTSENFEKVQVINPSEYINNDILKLLNNDKWNICTIPTPTNKELRKGIEIKYKNLSSIKEELLESFSNLVNFMNQPNNFSGTNVTKSLNIRIPSCNDFFKGCESISKQYFSSPDKDFKSSTFLNEKLRMKISTLFASVLIDHISLKRYRNKCQIEISKSFGINTSESEYYLKNGKFDIHFIKNGQQSRNLSIINIVNKELNIDINVNLFRDGLKNSMDPCSSRLVLKTNYQDDYKYLNYTFTSVHSRILFKIIMSIYNNENILLVGDTGTGKTTIIQQLHYMLYGADKNYINKHLEEGEDKFCELLVYNFNDQSESSDIIGSYRPINVYNEVKLLYDDYLVLLERSNIKDSSKEIGSKVNNCKKNKDNKRTAVSIEDLLTLKMYWKDLRQKCLMKLKDNRILNSENERQKHYFEFLDGILLKAIKEGHWLILDEVNLASVDILQRLIPILNRGNHRRDTCEIEIMDNNVNNNEKTSQLINANNKVIDSDYLTIPEKGNESIKIHPRFRLFSCMNPVIVPIEQEEQLVNHIQGDEGDSQNIQIKSTSGKKDLPRLIRALFTEYFVDELTDRRDLEDVVYNYLKDVLLTNQIDITKLVDIYLELKNMGNRHEITIGLEGNGHGIPNFSLRTFSSCLSYIRTILMLQANWRRNQNQLKLIECIGDNNNNNMNPKNGNSIIQNAILKQEISEIIHTGIMMSFATPLVSESYNKVDKLTRRILKMNLKDSSKGTSKHVDMNCVLFSAPKLGSEKGPTLSSDKINFINYMFIKDYVIRMGTYNKNFKLNSAINNEFVITPYIEQNLMKILRVLSGSRNPILIEGETSTGKTSLIKYISELTNHKFVRINNHEHTDTEEYFGKFIPNNQGELEFVEGPLVNSIRNGYWLVLDELNLAPSEVLESLNRLLDRNREIFIPETGEMIKAHEDFMLFATQNPAGSIYGGRKALSQAFRNRFVEIYFDEIPSKELEVIISKRSNIPVSYSELMVKVFMELKRLRSKSQMFSGDFSFVTVRDLLRWGNRLITSKDNVLDKKNLVIQGFYVIGERIRDRDEKLQLAEILFKICKPFEIKNIEEIINYSTIHINTLEEDKGDERLKKRRKKETITTGGEGENDNKIRKNINISMDGLSDSDKNLIALKDLIGKSGDYILTDSFKRMLTLVNDCIVFNEPAILVGSTGCGKTSIFQLLSTLYKKQLYIVNCHQQIEASDMLGSLRPIRSRILRLIQELNNFKIEFVAIKSRIFSNNDIKAVNKGFIESIISKVNQLNNLLDDPEINNNSKLKIESEINNFINIIESALKELESGIFSEILLLLDNMLNELKLYQDSKLRKDQALFEWQDGPIIKAMKTGSFLLLDEINLCDDSVIERLNSLLEDQFIKTESGLSYKSRVIYLTEKGGLSSFNNNEDYIIHSHKDFRIFATMNPSGDYGKRELSPALRNRFNEIFVPSLSMYQLKDDIEFLIYKNISKLSENQVSEMNKKMLSKCMIIFSILYENEIKNDQILQLKDLNRDEEIDNYFKLMIENGVKLIREDKSYSLVAFGSDSGNSSDVKEYTIRDIVSWCQFICNNFEEISNFYTINKEILIDYIKKGGNRQEFLYLKDENFITNYISMESMILTTLILGELFIQGASMLIIDGLNTHYFEYNEQEKEMGISLQLIYLERLIEIFYIYLIAPNFQGNNIIVGKFVKQVLSYRFLNDEGNNWIKAGGGKVLGKEFDEDQSKDLKEGYLLINQDYIELGPFKVKRKERSWNDSSSFQEIDFDTERVMKKFTFDSKTTLRNLSSIIRSMSIMKPILLEGAPGIGKTAIILTLSKLVGVKLHRINMSEQTDFSDLFGCEVPNSGGSRNKDQDHQVREQDDGKLISWIDGILLYAMKNGDWVILDELNLATQQILEGLNSVMDHRRNIYIPEIGQTIICHENFRIFATQNPVKMGSSGRKGLPQSFLNRFVRINVGKLTYEDYFIICNSLFSNDDFGLTPELIQMCIQITREIEQYSTKFNTLKDSSIWEWNLRDIIRLLRFAQLNLIRNLNLRKEMTNEYSQVQVVINSLYNSFETVYLSRLRTVQDYDTVNNIIKKELIKKGLFKISGIIDHIINSNIYNYQNNSIHFKKVLIFEDYLKYYILNAHNNYNIDSIDQLCCGLADYSKNLDFNTLPIGSKKTIISIIDCILLGENIILTCSNGNLVEEVILLIENISKKYFKNVRVNKVNVLPSIDANDLIGGYQQYNQENIMNEILDLISSLRVEFESNNCNENFKYKNLLNCVKFKNILNARNDDEFEFEFELKNYLNFLREITNQEKIQITPQGIIEEIENKLNIFESSKVETTQGPKFHFTFSTLINSIKNGDWLIISNIQNCSSALLDRLNSLLEDKENDLFIIESGIPQYVKRHENFRLFFVNDYNIQNKYISNALVNRCVDIFIDIERQDEELNKLKMNSEQTETIGNDNHHNKEEDLENEIDLQEESDLKEILTQIFIGFRLFEDNDQILSFLFRCDKCIEEVVLSILCRNKRYNRQVLDFTKVNYMDLININTDLSSISSISIYLVCIIINGLNNYILDEIIQRRTKLKMDKRHFIFNSDHDKSCIHNIEIQFQDLAKTFLLNENIQIMEAIRNGDRFFLINWMKNLLFSALTNPRKLQRVTKSHIFNIIEDSMIVTFNQFGLVQFTNNSDGGNEHHFVNFYMTILRMIENSIFGDILQEKQGKEFCQKYISKMVSRSLNPIFKEISIRRYDHIHEQYRDLFELILRKQSEIEKYEFWMDLIQINYLFVIYLRDILSPQNIYENIIYLTSLTKEITKLDDYVNYQNIQIKVLYVESILQYILKLFDITLNQNEVQDKSGEIILSPSELEFLQALRKYIAKIDIKILTSILSIVFNPIMRIQEKLLQEKVLVFTNRFSFTINSIISNGSDTSHEEYDIKTLIKRYIYDQRNINNYYGLSIQERESLLGLLDICEYYSIKETKSWVMELLIQILTRDVEDINHNDNILDLLQLFELLENNILLSDLEKKYEVHVFDNNPILKSSELLGVFDLQIKNGIFSNIIKIIRMKLKDENMNMKMNSMNTSNGIVKVVPKNKTYLETIFGSEISFLGYGVITNKDNFIMQKSLKDSFKVLEFLINKRKINMESIVQYYTQVQLCNLEFLDILFQFEDKKKQVLWKQLIAQIEDFNKEVVNEGLNNNNKNVSLDLKEQKDAENGKSQQISGISKTIFFEYYLMKQYVRSQFESGLNQGRIEKDNLIRYLNYLRELILKNDAKYYNKTHIIIIMIQIIKLISLYDSYSIYLDYLRKTRINNHQAETRILENMKRNHLMTSLLELDVSYKFEIEGYFELENENLQEDLLVDMIKESFVVMMTKSDVTNHQMSQDSSVNFGKEFEHILKLIMKFDRGIIQILFLNAIYHRLFNFKFHQVINLKSDYLSLFYYFNNQEIIPRDNSQNGKRDLNIQRMTNYFTRVIFDFIVFININPTNNNIDLDYLTDIVFFNIHFNLNCNHNSFEQDSSKKETIAQTIQFIIRSINSLRSEDSFSETLLNILDKYFQFIYDIITTSKENINISAFQILTKTCLVVINLPIYYHCRNLLYIDENKVYCEYNERISKNQEILNIQVKNRFMSYFHHLYTIKNENCDSIESRQENDQVLRKIDQDIDDRKEFVIFKMQEIITQILESDLVIEFLENMMNPEKEEGKLPSSIKNLNLSKLENFVILVQNISNKNNMELFQQDFAYFYSDIIVPIQFLLNSLLYGLIGIALFDNNTNLLKKSEKPKIKSLNTVLDLYEFENDLGLMPVSYHCNNSPSNNHAKANITVIELWKSLLEVGNNIHQFNTEFVSLYHKYYQDFEYNVEKTHEKLTVHPNENQETDIMEYEPPDFDQFINDNHLIYKNDNIDKFIEKNQILNEFDLMNDLIHQSDKILDSGSENKYNNIKYICLKILDIIILRYGLDQGLKDRFDDYHHIHKNNDEMKKYIFYNMAYNETKQMDLENGCFNCNSIWKFIILHLNQHKIFSQDTATMDSGNSYQHIKVHINGEIFSQLVNSEDKLSGIHHKKSILKNSELSNMIHLVERIQLIEKLKEILNQVQQLLLEYHNQPILTMIEDIVEKIIFMNIHKFNIITLICYLDILLMRLLKWDEYIKEGLNLNIEINNSVLRENIDFVRYSIYELRKLQINSWFNLVFRIFQKYNYMASFSFGNILVIVSKILIEFQEFNHSLIYKEIFDYLKTSTKGEFPIRFLFLRYISDLIIRILELSKISQSSFSLETNTTTQSGGGTNNNSNNGNSQSFNTVQFDFTQDQVVKLTKLSKILISILNFGEVIYRDILKDNQKLLQEIRTEIRDIVKLSMWEVKDYNKIKKNISSIQKQLKKNLIKFDEKLMIKVDLLIINNSGITINILPRLADFITNSELRGQESIGYIIKVLSDEKLNNDKMLKQRYYKTLIDTDTYNLQHLIIINNFNDFYYNNLDQYINIQKGHNIKISSIYKDGDGDNYCESKNVISLCFLILDQLRINESGKYNMNYMSQSLINYNKLLSIGNTLLSNLIREYQEFQSEMNTRFLLYNYLLDVNDDNNNNNNTNEQNSRFFIVNDNQTNNMISLREYLNYLLKVLNCLERIKMLTTNHYSDDDGIHGNNKMMIEFLIQDKLKHDKGNNQITSFIVDRMINKGLLRMINKLKKMFYISGLIYNNDWVLLVNWELIGEIERFQYWIKKEMDELVNIINLNFVNNGVFELDIILNYVNIISKFNLSLNTESKYIKECELIDDLMIGIEKEEIMMMNIGIFQFKRDINLKEEYISKFKLEYDLRNENLKNLSGITLEYIQALYLLLENEFFNICEKKEEEGEGGDDDKGIESNPNIDWKSGCGFGNDNNDYQSRDISSELNNDDSLLEGLKGEDDGLKNNDEDGKNNNNNKSDAVDTELDFNSKLEDLAEEDEEESKNSNDQKDDEDEEDPENKFDKVDLENKNSRIEDVKSEDDEGNEEDENDNSGEVEDEKKENIETRNKNQDEDNNNNNSEKDIVAKIGGDDEDDDEDDNNEKNKEDKKNSKDEEENKDLGEMNEEERDEINSLNSDLDELFEYDAKNINPYTNEEEGENEGENNEGENNDDEISMDNLTISDVEEETSNNHQDLEEGEDKDEDDEFGDQIGEDEEGEENDDEMKVDRYQSLGYQNDMDEELKEEDQEKDENRDKDQDEETKTSLNNNKGKNGVKSCQEELKNESNVSDKDARDENGLDQREKSGEEENLIKEEEENENEESDSKVEENDEDKGNENEGNDQDKGNEFGLNEESDKKDDSLMNPLLEENMDNNRDWYNSLKDLIIKDEDNNEDDDFGEFDLSENNSNFKIDKDNKSKSNLVQNLPSIGNEGSNDKMDVDLEDEKDRYEKKDLDNEIIKQEIENIEDFKEDGTNENNNKDDNLNEMNNRVRNMLSRGNDENEDKDEDEDDNNNDLYNKNDKEDDESNIFNVKEYGDCDGDNSNNDKDEYEEKIDNILNNSSIQNIRVWNKIQSEITPVVNLLSNQLRIILEPTIRGKMEGGFKTGKKLSMKKVITYIASDYRKDKIWLRRSKPSKREFNILMCIDNSQSMSVSNNEYMALQSLFIIIQSLQKIEVGNFGVCSFTGENIKQLIEMTSQINSNDAINMLNYFSFSEETLDSHQNSIPNILEYSTNLLKDFSNSKNADNGNKQCHQLIIIITDGRFNKSKVNVWINYAIQNNCIPVLIIIDSIRNNNGSENSSSSIFNMKSVSKDENGKMVITPYLENFPFPFYSVIQDPKKLPNILCELIKQWFELICS